MVNVLKNTELCTLNGWIVWHVNYISIVRLPPNHYQKRKWKKIIVRMAPEGWKNGGNPVSMCFNS